MLIPVSVVVSDSPERNDRPGVSANIHRRQFGALGRVKAAVILLRHGMPKPEIAAILAIGTTTLDRDLLIGTTDWVMDHIKTAPHHGDPRVELAGGRQEGEASRRIPGRVRGVGREDEGMAREENRRRQARDEDLLAGAELWPQKYLTRDQLDNWAEALKNGQPFGQPVFKFKALIKREKGTQRIEVDGLSKDVNELSAVDLGKVYERFADICEELVPVLERKLQEEGQKSEERGPRGKGRDSLRRLGLGDLADRLDSIEQAQAGSDGEADPDFDRAPSATSKTSRTPRSCPKATTRRPVKRRKPPHDRADLPRPATAQGRAVGADRIRHSRHGDVRSQAIQPTPEHWIPDLRVNHILFTSRCPHASIKPYRVSKDPLQDALRPLAERSDLTLAGFNLAFDIHMLGREGIPFIGQWPEIALPISRLHDQDRIESRKDDEDDDRGDRGTRARIDLRSPDGPRNKNYKLKDLAAELLGIRPLYTPSRKMALVPYATHATYLAHDLLITELLHHFLMSSLEPMQRRYSRRVLAPLLAILTQVTETGVAADAAFIRRNPQRLERLLSRIAEAHWIRHRVDLSQLGDRDLRNLLYKTYRLPVLKGPRWKGSIDARTLERLAEYADEGPLKDSLELIAGYRHAKDLRDRLASYGKYVDPHTGRIHSQFSFKQSSGRISSLGPNLQQLARPRQSCPAPSSKPWYRPGT